MENRFLRLVMALALTTVISSRSNAVKVPINDILSNISLNVESKSKYSIGIIYKEIDDMLSRKSKFFFGIEGSVGYEWNYNNITKIFCVGRSRIGFELGHKSNDDYIIINKGFALERIKKYTFIGDNDGEFKKLTSDSKIFAGYKTRVGFEWHNNFPASIPIISNIVSFTCTSRTSIEKVINDIVENSDSYIIDTRKTNRIINTIANISNITKNSGNSTISIDGTINGIANAIASLSIFKNIKNTLDSEISVEE